MSLTRLHIPVNAQIAVQINILIIRFLVKGRFIYKVSHILKPIIVKSHNSLIKFFDSNPSCMHCWREKRNIPKYIAIDIKVNKSISFLSVSKSYCKYWRAKRIGKAVDIIHKRVKGILQGLGFEYYLANGRTLAC